MFAVEKTESFTDWIQKLRDKRAELAIARRIKRAELGNLGDVKTVGEGVCEMRIDLGPGYRIYFTKKGNTIIILLVGGDKSTQARDIAKAIQLSKEI